MNLLIVDDDTTFRTRLAKSLRGTFDVVLQADSIQDAKKLLEEKDLQELFGAVIDLRMPGDNGIIGVSYVRERYPKARIVMLTGYGSISTATEAMKHGADDYVTKPALLSDILAALHGTRQTASTGIPTLEEVTEEYTNRVVSSVGGNISKAAKLLGLHRRSLQRKLSKA